VGGVSRYCRALSDLIGESAGGAVRLDLARTSSRELGIQRAPFRRLAKRLVGGPSYALRSAIARHRPRLVLDNHQFIWRDPGYPGRVRGIVPCPYVLVIHDGAFPEFVREDRARGARLREDLAWIAGSLCMSHAIRAALHDLAPSIRSVLLSPLLGSVPAADAGSFAEPLAGFFRRHESVIVTSGALAAHYGLRDVLDAFGVLRSRGEKLGLVLLLGSFANEQPEAEALREAVDRWGGDTILALVDFPAGPDVIAVGDVYVRPSRVDSFGLALHEAMQAGVPVLAARHDTRPAGALLYEPGDVEGLVAALEHALSPQAAAASAALAPKIRAMAERNRVETLEFLRSVAPADPRAAAPR
jgi:glycosyltransferase involved in cell wall biosynthesis